MEDILFNGDDSSSGESDTEQKNKPPPPKQKQQAPPPRSHAPPSSAVPAPTHPSNSNPSMSDASMKERLKQMYSPAGNKPRTPPQQQQQQRQPTPQQQQQRQAPQQQQRPPPQQQQRPPPQQQQPPQHQQRQQMVPQPMQVPPIQAVPKQQRSHPGPVQQKPQNLGMIPHQQRQSSSSNRMPVQQGSNQPHMGQSQQMMVPPPQRASSSGMSHHGGRMPQGIPHAIRNSGLPPQRTSSDPFEPTPIKQVMSHQHPQQRPISTVPKPTTGFAQRPPPSSGGMDDRQAMEKKQKEKFIVFTRVLMKYLEQKDKGLHLKVKEIIKDCAERNKRKERGYESVTASMKKHLKECVPEAYWKRAEAYMQHIVKKQSSSRPPASGSHQNPMPMQQRSSHGMAAPPKQQQPPPRQQRPQPPKQADQVLSNIRDDITKKQHSTTKPAPAPSFQPAQPTKKSTPTPAPTKGKSVSKSTRRSSDAGDSSSGAPREYNELLPMVDHATNYDWTTSGTLLGGSKTQSMLSEEQKKLLSDFRTVVPKAATDGVDAFPIYGWNSRNVVSARVAWARLRGATKTAPQTEWFNEDTAEEEKALAVLSEGAQIYMKSILEKALHSARLRQNFDGTRIWHQQRTEAKPEFSIRLGCDVNRQVALAQANAALTAKRMEEALARQPGVAATDKDINEHTLASATSMSDLAIKPELEKAVDTLTTTAKRNLEVHGGKDSRESPFGRTPKKPKLEVVDFIVGMKFSQRRGGQRASTLSPFTPFFSY